METYDRLTNFSLKKFIFITIWHPNWNSYSRKYSKILKHSGAYESSYTAIYFLISFVAREYKEIWSGVFYKILACMIFFPNFFPQKFIFKEIWLFKCLKIPAYMKIKKFFNHVWLNTKGLILATVFIFKCIRALI